jgi:hypothetical protein
MELSNNRLSGTIPELGNIPIIIMGIQQNQLTGTLPRSLFNSTSLLKLYLGDNKISGTLPAEFTTTKLATL